MVPTPYDLPFSHNTSNRRTDKHTDDNSYHKLDRKLGAESCNFPIEKIIGGQILTQFPGMWTIIWFGGLLFSAKNRLFGP